LNARIAKARGKKTQFNYWITRSAAKQYDGRSGCTGLCQKISKIPVGGNQYSLFVRCALQNHLVFCGLEAISEDMHGIMPKLAERLSEAG
jgi:hypothetical protein